MVLPDKKADEQITVASDGKNITINIPIDLLIFTQEWRESPYFISDRNAMVEHFKKIFTEFSYENYPENVSNFEKVIDQYFDASMETGETWLTSPEWEDIDE